MNAAEIIKEVRNRVGLGTVDPAVPLTKDPNVKNVGDKCAGCGSENVIVESHNYAGLPDHPSHKRTCLNCKRWDAIYQ